MSRTIVALFAIASSLVLSTAHADPINDPAPDPIACPDLYAGVCGDGGACSIECASICAPGGGEASTACKTCEVSLPEWNACYADPAPSCSGPTIPGGAVTDCDPDVTPCDAGYECVSGCVSADALPVRYCAALP